MRFGRYRLGMREGVLMAAAFAVLVALLIVWLGYRHDLNIDRLVEEGRIVQGEQLDTSYGPGSEGGYDEIFVGYEVNGIKYRTSMLHNPSNNEPPLGTRGDQDSTAW